MNTFLRNFICGLVLLLSGLCMAQQQWRFHLAFEDGTGARDTIWMVYDVSATLGTVPWPGPNVDTLLGEGPVNVNDGLFHVFRMNAVGDTTQTNAYPYSQFPNFDGTIIDAMNWVPPMTITWDTSLFHAPYLPYVQGSFGIATMGGLAFSAYNNHPELGFDIYDMLISDSITVDFLWDYLFQFGVGFGADDGLGISHDTASNQSLMLTPNPVHDDLRIRCKEPLIDLMVMDQLGRRVLSTQDPAAPTPVDVRLLRPGLYHVRAVAPNHHVYHGTFEKVD
ncbi:MAG: hypothetical protein IPL52_14945 [Flavobacteriales bacterium]|nr:hypothetical protein [Flavobacteriales bacterium]